MPSWLDKKINPSTRSRSSKQESKIAKDLKGKTSINSGATFGQNDVITDYCEVEAKTTSHSSYSLKVSDYKKLEKKCNIGKIPIFVIDFEKEKKSLAVLNYDDLLYLINKAN
jgi:hypothetical protein